MQIYNTPIMYNYNVKNKDVNSQPNFKGVKSLSSVKDGHGIEYGMRILGNKFNDFFATKGQKQITQNIASAFRAKAVVVFGSGCPTLINDEELSKCAEKYTGLLSSPTEPNYQYITFKPH